MVYNGEFDHGTFGGLISWLNNGVFNRHRVET